MRKLAAIMFTDIEGFTTMMQQNEAYAVTTIKRHIAVLQQTVTAHSGEVLNDYGDGSLCIFASVTEAMQCALEIQQQLQTEHEVPLRIGLHIGEVFFEDGKILGDGVNVASRIQSLGQANTILFSKEIFDKIKNHPEFKAVYLGQFDFKNIDEKMEVFALANDGLAVPRKDQMSGKLKELKKIHAFQRSLMISVPVLLLGIALIFLYVKYSDQHNDRVYKTIAVLPFENMDPDEKNNFLADGLTEETISLLSANPNLKIKKVTRNAIYNSGKTYLAGMLTEIKAETVLEGKVQHDKDSLLIFVKLRNTSTNEIIWAYTYHREFRELMNVQQQVAVEIAKALNTSFSDSDMKKFASTGTPNSEAYILYIKGRYALSKRTQSSMNEAIFIFNQALQKDSGYALAYSGMGDSYTLLIDNGYLPYDSGIGLARNALDHAFVLDSMSAEIRASRAIFKSSLEGKRVEALQELKFSLELNPNYAAAHQWYAVELAANSQFDSAISHIDKAADLEPFSERIWLLKCAILEWARRYREAITLLNYLMIRFPDNGKFQEQKTECFYWLGQKDSALLCAASGNSPLNDYEFWKAVISHDKKKLQELLQQTASTAPLNNGTLAMYYVFLGQNQNAIACLEDAYNKKEFRWLKFLNVSPDWDSLRKEPRFHDLLSKLGFK